MFRRRFGKIDRTLGVEGDLGGGVGGFSFLQIIGKVMKNIIYIFSDFIFNLGTFY